MLRVRESEFHKKPSSLHQKFEEDDPHRVKNKKNYESNNIKIRSDDHGGITCAWNYFL
jgi:hypothetical protein